MKTKLCPDCNQTKPWSEYNLRRAAQGQKRPQPHCRLCENARARKRGRNGPVEEMVAVEPFGGWLQRIMWRDDLSIEDLSWRVGIHERQVRRFLNSEQSRVAVRIVDAALCREGSTMLWEIYPSLYEGCIERNIGVG